jgi:hypothetical protein
MLMLELNFSSFNSELAGEITALFGVLQLQLSNLLGGNSRMCDILYGAVLSVLKIILQCFIIF